MPDFSFERNIPDLFAPVQGLVAGIDEAGRGPWAGPVVAGAVIFPNLEIPDYLRTTLNDFKADRRQARSFVRRTARIKRNHRLRQRKR